MAISSEPPPVRLVVSIIFRDGDTLSDVLHRLSLDFGEIDILSPLLPFDFTDYYYEEMGKPLKRRFVSFASLINRDSLPLVKEKTTLIEREFSKDEKRRFNIDPGLICKDNLTLATYKSSPHRIYLGRRVYADLTLVFRFGSFAPLDSTYPDYRTEAVIDFMNALRRRYLGKIRRSGEVSGWGMGR